MTALSAIPFRGLVICIGLVLPGISIFTIVYYRFREARYLGMILVASAVAVQSSIQLAMVITGAYAGNVVAAMQLHRLMALFSTLVLVVVPYFLSVALDHVPRFTRVNRLLTWIGGVIAFGMWVVAFVAPELFVSVRNPDLELAAVDMVDYGRGETGIVYLARNALLFLLAIYAAVVAVVDLIQTDERRYVMPITIGTVIAALLGLDDLTRLITGSYSGLFSRFSFSRFGVGFAVLVLCSAAALVDRFVRRAKQIRSLRIELVKDEQAVERFAFTDKLTGLGNAACLSRDLTNVVPASMGIGHGSVALCAFDIERFRIINASYGTARGDRCLQIIGERLNAAARNNERVYRMSATMFAIVLTRTTVAEAERRARQVAEVLAKPVVIDAFTIFVSVRTGVALAPEHAEHAQQLLSRCGAAAAESSSVNAPVVVYNDGLRAAVSRYGEVVRALHRAVDEDEFELAYQPIIRPGGRIVAAEALLRWRHSRFGAVSPGEFIPIAEDVGLIGPITRLVARKVVAALVEFRNRSVDLRLSMNLSVKELHSPNACQDLLLGLQKEGLDPRQVLIEVTESAVMRDLESAAGPLQSIVDAGFAVALDDFGTGRSSFSYLRVLPVHELKIDRAFMTGYPGDPGAEAMVRSIIELAHGLGLTVVAEGIEEPEQADGLAEEGCDFFQGFHFHRPMPFSELLTLATQLRRHDLPG